MLYPTTIYQPLMRDQDGLYPIDPNNEHRFPFNVPYMGLQRITLQHNFPNAEDWTISVSFLNGRDEPVSVFGTNSFEFKLDRGQQVIDLWGEGGGPEGAIEMDPTQNYVLKVFNCQNKANGYLLTFSV
jgi:hypothetical protein